MNASSLAVAVMAKDRRALARSLSVAEAGDESAAELLDFVRPHIGRARRIGMTGPPGAGKSSLVNVLVREARVAGLSVAVLAIDPSSPFSGGALLGDRVRMMEHALDPEVFIRSQASRLALGGLAETTHDMVDILDAGGFDLVIVETVGVGQSELEIVRLADVTVIVLAPAMGDMVQAMKAGLVEAGDLVVVNKGDLAGAAQFRDEIVAAFGMTEEAGGASRADTVLLASAATGEGVRELLTRIRQVPDGSLEARRRDAALRRLDLAVASTLASYRRRASAVTALNVLAPEVRSGKTSMLTAVAAIVQASLDAPYNANPRSPA